MVYVVGIIGFICGFVFGVMLISVMLRNVKRDDLLNDPYIKWKYGLLTWGVAGFSSYGFVLMYQRYFF